VRTVLLCSALCAAGRCGATAHLAHTFDQRGNSLPIVARGVRSATRGWYYLYMSDTLECVTDWMTRQRWYAGKDHLPLLRELTSIDLASADPDARIRVYLLMDDDGNQPTLYQVPIVERRTIPRGAGPYFIGKTDDDVYLFDGPHDPAYANALLAAAAPDLAITVTGSAVMSGEQSNTSIVYDVDGAPTIVCKVFRTLHHGNNPDVELQSALSVAGSPFVPRFVGEFTGEWQDVGRRSGMARGNLAFAQEYLPTAVDGWKLALRAAESREDFTEKSRALGEATARIHSGLADVMAARDAHESDVEMTVAAWERRLAISAREVPAVAARRAEIQSVYERAQQFAWPALQRVHGDLHLGQCLWIDGRGWLLIDFEGEPLRPMSERNRPDSPLRDVAGMLRSFDYAAGASIGVPDSWAAACRSAYLEGYASASGTVSEGNLPLLNAFELDKAVYEAIYESRNRPAWLHIPVAGIERVLARSLERSV